MGNEVKQTETTEIYPGSEHLKAFANALVMNGYGKRRIEGNRDHYTITHENLNGLECVAAEEWLGFGNATFPTSTLKGDPDHIAEFIRAASAYVKELVGSVENVEREYRKEKVYEKMLSAIEPEQIDQFNGRPLIRLERGWKSAIPIRASLGYVEKSLEAYWLTNGVSLRKRGSERGKGVMIHKIKNVKYIPSGRVGGVALCEGLDSVRFYTLDSDETVREVIERIKHDRPISIS